MNRRWQIAVLLGGPSAERAVSLGQTLLRCRVSAGPTRDSNGNVLLSLDGRNWGMVGKWNPPSVAVAEASGGWAVVPLGACPPAMRSDQIQVKFEYQLTRWDGGVGFLALTVPTLLGPGIPTLVTGIAQLAEKLDMLQHGIGRHIKAVARRHIVKQFTEFLFGFAGAG